MTGPPRFPKGPEEVLQRSGHPSLALSQWKRLQAYVPPSQSSPELLALLSLLGNSHFLTEYLLRHLDREGPDFLKGYLSPSSLLHPKSREMLLKELNEATSRETRTLASLKKTIRQFKYREMIRIAARDLSNLASFEETGREISALASACTEQALRGVVDLLDGPAPPFVVMGMGKLGGEDLNFSSDIDLIYVHGEEKRTPSAFESACRMAETLTHALQDRTDDGFGFRVDLDLRPEGKSGVIVNSLEALTAYYEASGAPWERSVWLKGRVIAGDQNLGNEALRRMEPFVYRKSIDSSAIMDLKSMKEKINAAASKKTFHGGFNVKLGRGGIREIEFFVSAFQLIFGGRAETDSPLRDRNTLKALEGLVANGLTPPEDAQGLREAYIFLRRIENRLQMEDERQLHNLPTNPEDLDRLARRCGYADAASFQLQLLAKTEHAAACFERLAE